MNTLICMSKRNLTFSPKICPFSRKKFCSSFPLLNNDNNNNVKTFEIGESAQIERTFSAKDVADFARLTYDFNPIHLDESAAIKRNFAKPVVHGALINGVISAVIGTILPGHGSILLEQDLHFTQPLYIDEHFVTSVKIADRVRNVYHCEYQCITREGKKVTEGKAKILFRP